MFSFCFVSEVAPVLFFIVCCYFILANSKASYTDHQRGEKGGEEEGEEREGLASFLEPFCDPEEFVPCRQSHVDGHNGDGYVQEKR